MFVLLYLVTGFPLAQGLTLYPAILRKALLLNLIEKILLLLREFYSILACWLAKLVNF